MGCVSPNEIRFGIQFRLCSLQIVWRGCVSANRSSLKGIIPGSAVCRLFGYVWGCISRNRNSFGSQNPAVPSVDCLDTYWGCFSIRLWVQSPAV